MPILSTTKFQPSTSGTFALPVVSIVLTDPPPPEPSTILIKGSWRDNAICSHFKCFSLIEASAEPPLNVKSSPPTTIFLPSIFALPKIKLDPLKLTKSLFSS